MTNEQLTQWERAAREALELGPEVFINPSEVLALIAEVRRLRKECDDASASVVTLRYDAKCLQAAWNASRAEAEALRAEVDRLRALNPPSKEKPDA